MPYWGPLLSEQTKRKKHKSGKTQTSVSPLRARSSLCRNSARKFKVALRRKATGIEDVLTLVFKEHLQSIGSLFYTPFKGRHTE